MTRSLYYLQHPLPDASIRFAFCSSRHARIVAVKTTSVQVFREKLCVTGGREVNIKAERARLVFALAIVPTTLMICSWTFSLLRDCFYCHLASRRVTDGGECLTSVGLPQLEWPAFVIESRRFALSDRRK